MKNPTQNSRTKYRFNRLFRLGVLFILLLRFPSTFGQEIDTSQTEELAIEKVYLHIDRSFYTAGEDIWFKAYLMNGRNHTTSAVSSIVYVELVGPNNQIISKRTLKTTTGSAAGDFKLSSKSIPGIYTIRGYTNYMRNFDISNFYTKEILVNTANPEAVSTDMAQVRATTSLDVQFFPEGGYLINGFLNPIAFKALDAYGNSSSITGKLVDDLGNLVTDFKSARLGMGLFHFIPKSDRTYSALISNNGKEERFQIPKILSSGVLMTISNQSDFYKIELRATSDLKLKDYKLLGKQADMVKFNLVVNSSNQEHTAIIKLAKDMLDEGALELTLFNQENRPIAERLLFHEKKSGFPIANITSAKSTYGRREQVFMKIALDSIDLNTITADMSLSVSNVAVNTAEHKATDIKTYILLSSLVQGKIEQPGYYFYSNAPERKYHLDILMRTQGWRQYELQEEFVKSSNYFLPEKGITLSGKVLSATNSTEHLSGSVSLTANSASEMVQDRTKTAEDGTFSFDNLNFTDTTTVLLSANVYYPKKKRNPTLNYKIILDSVSSPTILESRQISSYNSASKTMERFTTGYEKAQQTALSFLYNDKTIQLDEAYIAAKKNEKELDKFEVKRKIVPYKTPSHTVDFDGFTEMGFTNLLEALRGRVPGLTVRETGTGTGYVYLRAASSLSEAFSSSEGAGSALVLLNGMPVGGDVLQQMLPGDVDFIDILKGPRAAIYGSRGANGVIAVYSKNGTESSKGATPTGGSLNFEHPGYSYSRTFYVPKYEIKQPELKNLDNRTTLHWQPYIELNPKGKSTISFYAGDISGAYKVILEGVTSDGKPLKSEMIFTID